MSHPVQWRVSWTDVPTSHALERMLDIAHTGEERGGKKKRNLKCNKIKWWMMKRGKGKQYIGGEGGRRGRREEGKEEGGRRREERKEGGEKGGRRERREEGKGEGGRRREEGKEKEEGDETDLNVLEGGVNDLVVVWETVELECLQVQPDMVTHLCDRGHQSPDQD